MAEKEYIEREAAIKAVEIVDFYKGSGIVPSGYASDAIRAIPAADVRPVVRGHWALSDDRCWHTCSICGADIDVSVGLLCYVDNEEVCNHNFCPNCGADMRGEQDV